MANKYIRHGETYCGDGTTSAAELLAAEIAGKAGNPLTLMTNAQLVQRIVSAVESDSARKIFTDAANRVFSAMKAETVKVV